MKRYVDGYVLPVPTRKLRAYKKIASISGKIWIKHGALQYVECVGEDLRSAKKFGCKSFLQLLRVKKGETIIFAFVVYKSRAHRDRVNAKVMKEMVEEEKWKDTPMPFEVKRMAVGGFETLVNLANS